MEEGLGGLVREPGFDVWYRGLVEFAASSRDMFETEARRAGAGAGVPDADGCVHALITSTVGPGGGSRLSHRGDPTAGGGM